MKFVVKITQTLEGFVEIEADCTYQAIEIADKRFNDNGEQLPEMDDVDSLEFSISEEECECCGEMVSSEVTWVFVREIVPDEKTSCGNRKVFGHICIDCNDKWYIGCKCGYTFHHSKMEQATTQNGRGENVISTLCPICVKESKQKEVL